MANGSGKSSMPEEKFTHRPAKFSTIEDKMRALRRAERWYNNNFHKGGRPPSHILDKVKYCEVM